MRNYIYFLAPAPARCKHRPAPADIDIEQIDDYSLGRFFVDYIDEIDEENHIDALNTLAQRLPQAYFRVTMTDEVFNIADTAPLFAAWKENAIARVKAFKDYRESLYAFAEELGEILFCISGQIYGLNEFVLQYCRTYDYFSVQEFVITGIGSYHI